MACLFEGTYLLAELWGNNRKSEMLMKFTRVGCELILQQLHSRVSFFFNHFLLSHVGLRRGHQNWV